MNNVHVKKGDTVRLLVGDPADKYTDIEKKKIKTGKVVEVSPKEGKVIVEGINMITKHVKPTRVGQQGGIIKAESPIYACKVQLICPKCGKPTRVGHVFIEGEGKTSRRKRRVCKQCKAVFDN